jgi:vitamin K-dependent gamma-carboxylase
VAHVESYLLVCGVNIQTYTKLKTVASFRHWLAAPVEGHVLGLFRLVFGLFMVYHCFYYHKVEFINKGLLAPQIHFGYEGFSWLPMFPAPVLQIILLSMAVGALMMALGWGMRIGAVVHGLGLAYFLLLEKAYYNNHIYMFVLVSFLLALTDADRFFSLRGNKGFGQHVPRWQVFIFQLQILIVYVYGGIAKLTPDWMFRQEPVRTLVFEYVPDSHWMASLLKNNFSVYLLTYGGFVIDFFAPLFLLIKPLRRKTFVFFVLFHLANSQIFKDISIFPFVMLAGLVVYFETEEIPWLRGRVPSYKSEQGLKQAGPVLRWGLGLYVVWQLLFPFRGYFLPNPMDYTTIGNRFSWHMKVDTRRPVDFIFTVGDPASGIEKQVDIFRFVNDRQILHMAHDPRSVAVFAGMLKDVALRAGAPQDIWVKARINIVYNGRPAAPFVDPQADLTAVDVNPFHTLSWVVRPQG